MNTFNSVTCPLKSASDIGCLICCVATAVFFGFRRTTFLSVAEEPSLQAMSCLRFSRSCLSLELRALQKYVCTVHNSFCQHVGTCMLSKNIKLQCSSSLLNRTDGYYSMYVCSTFITICISAKRREKAWSATSTTCSLYSFLKSIACSKDHSSDCRWHLVLNNHIVTTGNMSMHIGTITIPYLKHSYQTGSHLTPIPVFWFPVLVKWQQANYYTKR